MTHDRWERRAFRAWAWANHPDLGGDPAEFAAGLERWRALRNRPPPVPRAEVSVFRSRHGLWLLIRWWKRRRRRQRRVL